MMDQLVIDMPTLRTMMYRCWCCVLMGLSACGGGDGSRDESGASAVKVTRDGISYSVYIEVGSTGDTVAFTVHEPAEMTEGQTYPLILYGHGGGESRVRDSEDPASAYSPLNNPKLYRDNGYGVISMDQRGHGESSGSIRLMDPEYEGLNLLAILDWAEANLDWLAYQQAGPDAGNMKLGAIGGSYGGAFQLLINNIDSKSRLDAIIPETTWYDLNDSIAPNGVLKSLWQSFLTLRLSTASNQINPSAWDPFVQDMMSSVLLTGRFDEEQSEFLRYHSPAYFCEGEPLATAAGTADGAIFTPRPQRGVDVLLMQGMRDTLFNLNEAWRNYRCLQEAGADVRLMTYQYGHNATPVVPDAGVRPTVPDAETRNPPLDSFSNQCHGMSGHSAGLAFMDEHVKGIEGAADAIPKRICLSLSAQDSILLTDMPRARATQAFELEEILLSGVQSDYPQVILLGEAGSSGAVIAGIPHIQLSVKPISPLQNADPILFAGIGVMTAETPGVWQLADNQLTPIRGVGQFDLELAGIGERLQPGDQYALLMYSAHHQYAAQNAINRSTTEGLLLSLSGTLWLPISH